MRVYLHLDCCFQKQKNIGKLQERTVHEQVGASRLDELPKWGYNTGGFVNLSGQWIDQSTNPEPVPRSVLFIEHFYVTANRMGDLYYREI